MSEATLTADQHVQTMRGYVEAGESRARALGNRGPVRYDQAGRLHPEILEAYWQTGFYVFEGLIAADEIALLRDDFARLIEGAPVDNLAELDAHGRPAIGRECAREPYSLIRPLSDPWGGTDLLGGRHPTRMSQPAAAEDAPRKVVFLISGMCQLSEPALRLYGHPDVLSIAAGVNGSDFVPYNDATFVKPPRLGGSVSWHQDGVTHWDSPNWDEGIHGFNFQVQLYTCSGANGLWVVPGTHKLGKLDIAEIVAEHGTEYLPDAVPLLCSPGDVTIANRQVLHCSFANSSDEPRISITFGFHRYASVLGARGALSQTADEVYDEARIRERAKVVQLAIDARAQFYPNERRFEYSHFAGEGDRYRDTPENRAAILRDYNLNDLSI